MQLARQAIREGVIISKKDQFYQNVNFYNWYINHKKNFSEEEWKVFNQLISFRNVPVRIVDILNNKYKEYVSINEAGKALYKEFHIAENGKSGILAIHRRLNGQVTTPYKGRFMFYYATDEEIKRYLEENEVS